MPGRMREATFNPPPPDEVREAGVLNNTARTFANLQNSFLIRKTWTLPKPLPAPPLIPPGRPTIRTPSKFR